MLTTRNTGIAVVLLIALTSSAFAARVRRLSLEELRDRADTIALITVVSSSSRPAIGAPMVWTDFVVHVDDVMKGRVVVDSSMTLSFAGGRAGGLDVGIDGVTKPIIGRQYLVFLQNDEARPMPTVGWNQGLFSFERSERGETILTSADGEPLQVTATGALLRGSRIRPVTENVAKASRRLQPGSILNANGTTAEQSSPTMASTPRRIFATIDDVRRFARERTAAVRKDVR